MSTTPFDAARAALSRLHQAGHPGWMVGGGVRDHLLGEPTERLSEIDLVTAAPVPEIERLFRPTVPVGRAFGILRVRHAGVWFEVATLRAEPSETADLATDARHRDFTINALYWDPDRGGIVDVVSGRRDLEARLVRGVADPEARFREDPLRALRAVRFGAWRDFRLEPATLAAAQRVAPALAEVAFERVKDELAKIATRATIRRGDAWRTLCAMGLLPVVFPELSGGEAPDATARVLDRLECRTLPLFLAALTRRALPPGAPARRWVLLSESLKQRLKLSSEEEKATAEILVQRQRYEGFAKLGLARRRLLATRGDRREAEDLLAAEGGHEELLRTLVELRDRYGAERPPPLLDGGTLKAAGLAPGPGFGRRLRRARLLQLAGRVATRAEALRAIGVPGGS